MGSERMAKYIVKRVIMALITILVVACVTFVLMLSLIHIYGAREALEIWAEKHGGDGGALA